MKRIIMAGLLGLMVCGAAFADIGAYVGVHGGAAMPGGDTGDNFNTGPDVGAQVGYQLNNLRAELAFTYLNNGVSDNTDLSLGMTTLMSNLYYDLGSGFIRPFVGGGMGWVHAWVTNNTPLTITLPDNNEFAYQFMSGLRAYMGRHFVMDATYRRLSWTDGNGAQNLFELGLNYVF